MKFRTSIMLACAFLGALTVAAFVLLQPSQEKRISGIEARYTNCISLTAQREIGACLRTLASDTVSETSVEDIEGAMTALADPRSRGWCHEFMHYAGWALYDETRDFADSFSAASGICDSGMMHGVVEQYISVEAGGSDVDGFVQRIAPSTCESKNDHLSSPNARGTCNHGLGHAFMFLTDNALQTSLTYCDSLGESAHAACYAGVYMEEIQQKQVGRTSIGHESAFSQYSATAPDRPCDSLETRYKPMCYRYIGSTGFTRSRGKPIVAFEACDRVNRAYQMDCFWGAGNNMPSPGRTGEAAARDCIDALRFGAPAYKACIDGGVNFVVQMARGATHEAYLYCGTVVDTYRTACFSSASKAIRNWSPSDEAFAAQCSHMPEVEADAFCSR